VKITRGGHDFFVEPDPQSTSWGFWENHFATGRWEPELLELLDRLLQDGGLYLDVGAWIGPTVLWASRYADRIVAVEPDPVAFDVLTANVALNGLVANTRLVNAAIADRDGPVELWARDGWGSSMSTLLGDRGMSVKVAGCRLASLELDDTPVLVKMDIEGGEAVVLPDAYPLLVEWGAPLLLSVHWRWLADEQRQALRTVLDKAVSAHQVDREEPGFETLLVAFR